MGMGIGIRIRRIYPNHSNNIPIIRIMMHTSTTSQTKKKDEQATLSNDDAYN